MASLKEMVFEEIAEVPTMTSNKITVVGLGNVGMACIAWILGQNITNEICLISRNEDKAKAEMMDIQHGAGFTKNAKLTAGENYSLTVCSRICIITAGISRTSNESDQEWIQKNCDLIKKIVPKLIEHSPNTILLIVTNPVDIMTYVAWKVSGLPKSRVIGSGTLLESVRFHHLMSKRLRVAANSCHGWLLGEHGDNCVVIWSGVNIDGCHLRDINPIIGVEDDSEKWKDVHLQVVNIPVEIVAGKGCIVWGVAACVGEVVANILRSTNMILPVSTSAMGFYGIEDDVFLSLPCVINSNGIKSIVNLLLCPDEQNKLNKSATILRERQHSIGY